MYKKSRIYSLILLIIIFISLFYSNRSQIKIIQTSAQLSKVESVNLIIDSLNFNNMVKNFRKTSDLSAINKDGKLNVKGLSSVNISGSQQFSEFNLQNVIDSISTKLPITIIDLRQESHGFINGIPVSWANTVNNGNIGLTKEQVVLDECEKLRNIKLNTQISFHNHLDKAVIVTKVENENQLVNSKSLKYIRIPVTDGSIPTDEMVDYFIDIVRSQFINEDKWIHFHCKAGVGRTTTFMIMYDIMKNFNQATFDEIVQRQLVLANFNEEGIKSFYSDIRINFLSNFYKYCKENNFNIKWSEWKK